MQKSYLQVKIGALMALAIILISATGYLSFRSLSAIVSSIKVKAEPDLRLLTIRELSNDLDRAENSVRMYTHTRDQKDIRPYYTIIAQFDDKIDRLKAASSKDSMLLVQIDTISTLIEDNIVIWNEMLNLYHSDSLDVYIRKLSAKMAVATLNPKNEEKRILKRVFGKKAEKAEKAEKDKVQEEIIRDLNEIEKQNSIQNTRLLETETQLARTGEQIRERFYIVISNMEGEVISSINLNAKAADKLALKTYRWLAMFALLGTLLVIVVLIIVARFVRKTRDYQIALIRSKEETEKLASTREMFMANMSHEIRTPVSAIYGFTEQLEYEILDEKSRKMLGIIKSSSKHLVKIVNDILDISKLQNARIVLEKNPFSLKAVLDEIQLLFKSKAAEKNTQLTCSISPSVPKVLIGDPYRLKQILMNLAGNAVKFTENGEIDISAECETEAGTDIKLILTVRDTGIGISKDMQVSVFDEFTQERTDTGRKYGGTGLGLSIVKKLVELHNGQITLKSQKGIGTAITCIIPYSAGDEYLVEKQETAVIVPDSIKNLRILIVDDEEYNRLLFETILNRWHIRYEEATDGRKALDMIRDKPFDLVFMDIRMPGLNGLETSAYIRKELKIKPADLPVIGISATHTPEEVLHYRESGMNTFLPKPFTEKMLLDTILSVLHEKTAEDKEIPVRETSRINLNPLYQMADHDIPFVKQMLGRFIEGTEEGLQQIHQAVRTGNFEIAMETAHKIAAPCNHIGADFLYAQLKEIENAVQKNKNKAKLMKLDEASQHEFKAIKALITEHIKKLQE